MDWFVLTAALGALWATVWNALAALRMPSPHRRMFSIISAFSSIYIVGWGWLLVYPETDRAVWSAAITPASMASFYVVWSGPAILQFFLHHPKTEDGDDGSSS